MREVFPAGLDDPGSSSEDHVVEYIRSAGEDQNVGTSLWLRWANP